MNDHAPLPTSLRALAWSCWGICAGLLMIAAPVDASVWLEPGVLLALGGGALAGARLVAGARQVWVGASLASAVVLLWVGPGALGLLLVALLAGVGVGAAARAGEGGSAPGHAAWLGAGIAVLVGSQVLLPALGSLMLGRVAAGVLLIAAVAGWGGGPGEARALTRVSPVIDALVGAAAALGWKAAVLLVSEAAHGSAYAVPLAASAALVGASLGLRWRARRWALTADVLLAGLAASWWLGCPVLASGATLLTGLTALFRHSVDAWGPLQLASWLLWAAAVAFPALFVAAVIDAGGARGDGGRAGGAGASEPAEGNGGPLAEARGGSRVAPSARAPSAVLGATAALGAVLLAPGVFVPAVLLLSGGLLIASALALALIETRGRGAALAVATLAALLTVAQVAPLREPGRVSDARRLIATSVEEGHRVLRVNGVVLGSDGADRDWQILAPQLSVLGRAAPARRAVLLGAGTGVPLQALLALPFERVDVVVASGALQEAAANFSAESRAALEDPRCHVIIGTPWSALSADAGRWDAIVALPDAEHGVSEELVRAAARHLAPGGRLVQVLTTVDTNDALVKLAVRTVRAGLPHATLWLGPDLWAVVASAEPSTFDLAALEAQLRLPAVAEALGPLGLHSPATLLMRQALSEQGLERWAGEGATNSADRDLLRFGAPVAALVAADASLPDERSGRGSSLAMAQRLSSGPLTPAELRDGLEHLSRAQLPNDPLVRSLAEAWFRVEPSREAAVALARAGLAQGSPAAARRALAPLIAAGDRSPAVVTQWLVLRWAEQRRSGAPFSPVDVSDALSLGREVLAASPGDRELSAALARLEAAQ